jgi:hypothetical protein
MVYLGKIKRDKIVGKWMKRKSYGKQHHVVRWKSITVSEENIVSIFRTEYVKQIPRWKQVGS